MVIKNIKGGISIINIIIIIGLILLAYLSYTQYLDKKVKTSLNSSVSRPESKTVQAPPAIAPTNSPPESKTLAPEIVSEQTPAPKTVLPAISASQPGYYRNNTYFYEIDFPPDWPIRVRSEANISLGITPPKNGQGAITIEVAAGEGANEIQQAKTEAAKYPGLVSLTEQSYTLAGVIGTKITLNNFMAKTKNIYILLVKNGLNYIIKYSEESAEFSREVEQALSTFKFTR